MAGASRQVVAGDSLLVCPKTWRRRLAVQRAGVADRDERACEGWESELSRTATTLAPETAPPRAKLMAIFGFSGVWFGEGAGEARFSRTKTRPRKGH